MINSLEIDRPRILSDGEIKLGIEKIINRVAPHRATEMVIQLTTWPYEDILDDLVIEANQTYAGSFRDD